MDPDLRLPRARAGASRQCRFEAVAAASGSVTKVYLYSPIGSWYGVTAQTFVETLEGIDTDRIELHVNSPGGLAFDGIAMRNALRQHEAHVTAIVDGLAASAASMVILGADEIVMAPGAELMIHDPSGLCWGDAAEMRKTAETLDKLGTSYARAYARRAGGDADAWRALMLEETWYLDEEAVEAGLADRVLAEDDDDAEDEDATALAQVWDLSVFRHAGRAAAGPPPPLPAALTLAPAASAAAPISPAASVAGAVTPGAQAAGDTNGKESRMLTDEQYAQLCQRVGVAADADADTTLAALDEALAERAEPMSLPSGARIIDEATYDDLVARATRGDEAVQAEATARREAAVDAAVAEGRIPPSRRDHWVAQMNADEAGASQVLAELAPGTIPVDEIGHAATTTDDTQGMEEYHALFPKGA